MPAGLWLMQKADYWSEGQWSQHVNTRLVIIIDELNIAWGVPTVRMTVKFSIIYWIILVCWRKAYQFMNGLNDIYIQLNKPISLAEPRFHYSTTAIKSLLSVWMQSIYNTLLIFHDVWTEEEASRTLHCYYGSNVRAEEQNRLCYKTYQEGGHLTKALVFFKY